MSLIKKFANAVRVRTGFKPLIVTTSEFQAECETSSPLLEMFTKRDSTTTETLPCRFIAAATEGLRHPEKQLWKITADIQDGRFKQEDISSITYPKMMQIMRNKELWIAKQGGVQGSDAEIISQRKKAVPRNNVFKFAT